MGNRTCRTEIGILPFIARGDEKIWRNPNATRQLVREQLTTGCGLRVANSESGDFAKHDLLALADETLGAGADSSDNRACGIVSFAVKFGW
jgi:hypothetical protein